MPKRKVAFKTLGCRLNQFETDALVTDFHKADYEVVGFNEKADVYIINTCTVTQQGDHKSKTIINQASRRGDGSLLVVTGCMATSAKEYLESRGDISYVVENIGKSQVLHLVESHFRGEMLHLSDLKQNLFDFSIAEKSFHTRSMVKIQDGCDNFCSFCIVPSVRGSAVSRPVMDITSHIRRVADLGYKEVVLTGVNISRYNYEGVSFEQLIEKVLEIPGDFRVRISSMEPEGFGDRFIDLFSHGKLCPHLHLCLQSGADNVLRSMGRNYSTLEYRTIIDKLRERYPLFNFTTDIMVGFPGETDRDFEASCHIVREIGFSHVHTFKYSVRKGTRAERMPEQVPEKVKNQRSDIIRQISDENKLKYYSLFAGREQEVLVEKCNSHLKARGYGQHYVPVVFKASHINTNYIARVTIEKTQKTGNELVLQGRSEVF
jgi:threonylcarbamoyladenosine tRNA methylthiotransferase MtaB